MPINAAGHSNDAPERGPWPFRTGPQHVVGKENGEVEDHAYHGRSDSGERSGEAKFTVGCLDHRATDQDEEEARQKSEKGGHACRHSA